MKSCFTSDTQENNVSLKSQEINSETTYVKVIAGKQLQDQSNMSNEKGTAVTGCCNEVFFSDNVSEQIVLVSKSTDEPRSGNAGNEGNVTQAKGKQDADSSQTSDSSNEETSLCPQPKWFTTLEEISRGKVREMCKLAGPPPPDQDAIEKLRAHFNIDLGQALEVNELYHSDRLQKASQKKPKSILKGSSSRSLMSEAGSVPTITRRLSWVDEKGGNLVVKHELNTWHYMDSSRNKTNQCCPIL